MDLSLQFASVLDLPGIHFRSFKERSHVMFPDTEDIVAEKSQFFIVPLTQKTLLIPLCKGSLLDLCYLLLKLDYSIHS